MFPASHDHLVSNIDAAGSTDPTDEPNTRLADFDLALPGSQPVFQWATLIPAIRAAIALGCAIQPESRFDRKHYFYHDQPAGYQITQYYRPFARNGVVYLDASDGLPEGEEVEVGIKQVQMEQDTARTQEQDDETTLIDFNRAGHALIEIISLPHLHSPKAAAAYVRKVQALLTSVDALAAGMEMGGLRADVNVSVKRAGSDGTGLSYSGVTNLGTRTEIKNISTIKGVQDAIRAERDRQIAILRAGGTIDPETRGWSLTNPGLTRRLRGKEGEVDYRYMPDPDIPPLHIGLDLIDHLHRSLPPSPDQLTNRLVAEYALSRVDAKDLQMLDNGERLIYFQDVVEKVQLQSGEKALFSGSHPQHGKLIGNWVLHKIGSLLSTHERTWTAELVPVAKLARIISLVVTNKLTDGSATRVLQLIFEGDTRDVDAIVDREGLAFEPLPLEVYEDLATQVIAKYPDIVTDIGKGKHGKLNFLLGEVMKSGPRGRMQASTITEVLSRRLLVNP
jgi:aspartyl-tRNA(Asn)/glutamyl-tRNA(Gln) amidotransferase subunit B